MSDVNVLVASHPGRQNGCCEELFEATALYSAVTIISDPGKQYASQETVKWCAQRARGIKLNRVRGSVLTTRKDGRVLIEADAYSVRLRVGA